MKTYNTIDACLADLIPWNEAYRNGTPVVPDSVYDPVWDKLEELVEAKRRGGLALDADVQRGLAFLNQIGALPPGSSGWPKFTHPAPMLSLNKSRDLEELKNWLGRHKHFRTRPGGEVLVVSQKLDGFSLRLYYKDGWLTHAVTRGDVDPMTGKQVGEDITSNVVQMKDVQVFLRNTRTMQPVTGFVRAEVRLRKSVWEKHLSDYDNARNGAVGIAKDEKSSDKCCHLELRVYQLEDGEKRLKTDELQLMADMGLKVVQHYTTNQGFHSIEGIFASYVADERAALDWDIDGLVIEFNDPEIMDEIGVHGRGPDGATALKFPADKARTILKGIDWQIGGTGRITPVALFASIKLAGAMISKASFHNLDLMQQMLDAEGLPHFFEGDTIEVSRRGDVIPYVEKLVKMGGGKALRPPRRCPSCASVLVRDGAYLVCAATETCPAQGVGRIVRWVEKLGVKDVGESLVQAWWDAGLVRDQSDLYTLDLDAAREVTIGGSKAGRRADIAIERLNEKKELPLHVFVGALSIPLIARSMAKKVVDAGYDSLAAMSVATVDELASIPSMGSAKANSLFEGLDSKKWLIGKLLNAGITIKVPSVGAFTGKSFCMTGVRDKDLAARIEQHGGTMKSSVGKTLTFLVCKSPDGKSGKLNKARKLGVTLLSLEDAWDLAGGR